MNSREKTPSALARNKTQPEEFDMVILGGGTGSTIAAMSILNVCSGAKLNG